jgi:CheY-like chemotaxis protein
MSTESLWDAVTSRRKAPMAMPRPRSMPARSGGALCAVRNTGDILPGLTILAVDDEPLVLEVIAEALGDLGLRIVTCRDAGEGLGAFALLDGPAVLVTDVGLHGLTGPALADAFRDTRPNGAVVFTTSRQNRAPDVPTTLGPRDIVLPKPFGRRELRVAIGRAAALASSG